MKNYFDLLHFMNLIIKIFEKRKDLTMEYQKYVCGPCGYIYDPVLGDADGGIAPGTPFEELPEDWVCPICGLGKEVFQTL